MTVYDWLMFLIGAGLIGVGLMVHLPRHWAGKTGKSDLNAARFIPYSIETRLGLRRSLPTAIIAMTAAFIGVAISVAADAAKTNTDLALIVEMGLYVVALALIFVVIPMIVLFNRPKVLVAPCYRTEKGALTLWHKGRRQRRSGGSGNGMASR